MNPVTLAKSNLKSALAPHLIAVASLLLAAASAFGGATDDDELNLDTVFDDDELNVATVFVTNWRSNSVSRLDLTVDGSLTLREVVNAPTGSANALGAALSLDRQSLYVAQWGSGSPSAFHLDRDRPLTALQTVPAAQPTPTDSAQVVLSPSGRRACMTNFNGREAATLSIYEVSAEVEALATILTRGKGAAGATISADGRTLYVAHMTSGDVTAFRIADDSIPEWLGTWTAGLG